MLNPKTLKPKKFRWMYADETKSLLGNIVYGIKKYLIWPVTDKFRILKERTKRSYAYARFGWLNYDFDMACAWDLFEFKLRRLYKCLENGHAIQEPEDMKALRELIKIVRRLGRGRYEDIYYRQLDKKWGKIESKTTPNYDKNGKITTYTYHSWRKNCPEDASEELKAREMNDRKCCWENAEKDRVRDLERMKDILVKHGQKWWD